MRLNQPSFNGISPGEQTAGRADLFSSTRNKLVRCQFLPIGKEEPVDLIDGRFPPRAEGNDGHGRWLAITLSCASLMRAIFTLIVAKLGSINLGRRADL